MMITEHIAAGIIIGSAFNKSKSKNILSVSILSSMLADSPILFFGGPGEIDYLSHRIYTHSVILSPVYAIIPILLIYVLSKKSSKNNYSYLYFISFLAFLAHIFIDLLTPYGVQLFYPFSNKIYSLDLFHAFDPIAILLSISIILFSIYQWVKLKDIKRSWILTFTFTIALYTIYTIIVKTSFSNEYSEFISENKEDATYLTTVPRTFWRWKGLARKDEKSYVIMEESDSLVVKEFESDTIINPVIKSSTAYLKFNQYARYPIIHATNDKYSFFNLVYSPKSYRLTLKLNNKNEINFSEITNFDILDNH